MADPNQTPERGDWKCPCNGCKKARNLVLREIQEILDDSDIPFAWHKAQEFIRKELKKK